MLEVFELWFFPSAAILLQILPADLQVGTLRVVGQALLGLLLIRLADLVGTGVPAVGTGLALGVLNADLIGGAQLGAGVAPRPGARFLTEEAFRTVLMTIAVIADLETLALVTVAYASPTLEAAIARPSVVQILVESRDFTAERLRLPLVELRVLDCSVAFARCDSLSEFINPSIVSCGRREVTS